MTESSHNPLYFHNNGFTSTTTTAVEVQLNFNMTTLITNCVRLQEVVPKLLKFSSQWGVDTDIPYFKHVINNACELVHMWAEERDNSSVTDDSSHDEPLRRRRSVLGWAGNTFLSALGINSGSSPTSEHNIIHALTLEESQMGRLHSAYKKLEETDDTLVASLLVEESTELLQFQATQLATHTVELTRAIEGIRRLGKLPRHSLLIDHDIHNLIGRIHNNFSVPGDEYQTLLYEAPATVRFGSVITFSIFLPVIHDVFTKYKVLEFPMLPKDVNHGVPLIWRASDKKEIAISPSSGTFFYPEETLRLEMGNMEFSFPPVLYRDLSDSCLGQLVTQNRTNLPICSFVIFKGTWAAVPLGTDTLLVYSKHETALTVTCDNETQHLSLLGINFINGITGCEAKTDNFLLPKLNRGYVKPINVSFLLTFQNLFPREDKLEDVMTHARSEDQDDQYEQSIEQVQVSLKRAQNDEFYFWLACGIGVVVCIILIFLVIHYIMAVCSVS